ncbi:hypothetical protein OC861_002951 [Tilletia horrida]|nr:hypothetical protein OC861_002951 [Tilletia horrida]
MPGLSHLSVLAAVSSLSGAQFGFDTAIISGALVSIHSDLRPSSSSPTNNGTAALTGQNGTVPASYSTLSRPLNTGEQELIVSITTVGAIVGALASGYLSRFWGRRTLTMVSSILFALGSVEQAASQYVREMVLGRAIVGLAIGLASMVTPTYLSEVCPSDVRGRLVSLNIFFVTAGQVIAYAVSASLFHLPHSWRFMILIGVIPAIVQLVGVIYLDESPRWLISRGRERQARETLKRIYPTWTDSQIDAEMSIIRASSGNTTNTSDAASAPSSSALAKSRRSTNDLVALFRNKAHRKALVLACGLQLFQQLCGFNALCYFGASILRMAGFRSNPVLAALPIAVANCAGTAIAMRLVDRPRFGRRKLLLWTTAFAALWLALLGAALRGVKDLGDVEEHKDPLSDLLAKPEPTSVFAQPQSRLFDARDLTLPSSLTNSSVANQSNAAMTLDALSTVRSENPPSAWAFVSLTLMVAFTMSYALGLGVIPWVVQAEALGADVRLRAVGGALATASNWTANLFVSAVFLDLVHLITLPGSFMLYSGITMLAWVFAWFNLPEMSGLDIDHTSRMFERDGLASSTYRPVRGEDDDERGGDSERLLSGRAGLRGERADEEIWRVHDSEAEENEDEDEEGNPAAANHKRRASNS